MKLDINYVCHWIYQPTVREAILRYHYLRCVTNMLSVQHMSRHFTCLVMRKAHWVRTQTLNEAQTTNTVHF